jgi:hypothetical protein
MNIKIEHDIPAPSAQFDAKGTLSKLKNGIGCAIVPNHKLPSLYQAAKLGGFKVVSRKYDETHKRVWRVTQKKSDLVKIEKNVPAPVSYDYASIFNSLDLGNSFVIPRTHYQGFQQASRKLGYKLKSRKVDELTTRVWRMQ